MTKLNKSKDESNSFHRERFQLKQAHTLSCSPLSTAHSIMSIKRELKFVLPSLFHLRTLARVLCMKYSEGDLLWQSRSDSSYVTAFVL